MTKKILCGLCLGVLALVFAGCQPSQPKAAVCPKDGKICSDGSIVQRTGPNCEFAACPEAEVVPPADTNTNTATNTDTNVGLANPASVNCKEKGGTAKIESKIYQGQDLGQFGVCYFDDNRQCEEWALMRGECPVGGLKVTGYATEAARYCAITGGTYDITVQASGGALEQGTCSKAGKVCEAWKYYVGDCQ